MSDIIATGRRKTAIAQIRLRDGSGTFKINGKDFTDYFPSLSMQNTILRPLEIANSVHRFDVEAKASGGGIAGQAGALRLAISRAIYAERRDLARLAARRGSSHARSPDEGAKEVGSARSAQTVSVLKAIVARVLYGAAAFTGFSVDFYRG